MQMRDSLPGVASIVDHEAVARGFEAEFTGHLRRGEEKFSEDHGIVRGGDGDVRDDFFGDHEHMSWRLGGDVTKGDEFLRLIDNLGGDFPGHDAFKERHAASLPRKLDLPR